MGKNKTEPSPTELLLLGLLYTAPLHGYELNKLIEERGIRQWANIGFSSIYYLLEKLEVRGLVKSNGAKSKAKKTFSITAAGKKVCVEQTRELIENRVANKNPFMTGLATSFVLSDAEFNKLLKSRIADLDSQLKTLRRTWENQKPLPRHADLLFSFSVSQIESEIVWVKSVLTKKRIKQ